MSQEFEAIYTQGHLVPLGPVELREQEKVRVIVEPVESARAQPGRVDLKDMNLHQALVATGLLGIVAGEVTDLSTNPNHMDGFGQHERNSD